MNISDDSSATARCEGGMYAGKVPQACGEPLPSGCFDGDSLEHLLGPVGTGTPQLCVNSGVSKDLCGASSSSSSPVAGPEWDSPLIIGDASGLHGHERSLARCNSAPRDASDSYRLPQHYPYVGSFHRGSHSVAAAARDQHGAVAGDLFLPASMHACLPQHNPYVGSFHRGAALKRKADDFPVHAGAGAKRRPSSGTLESTECFVQQFLPLGMMSAALAKHKPSAKRKSKDEPART